MEEYNLQEIRIEDYNSIKEYYQMRRPETADSNILDLYIWLNCYPTWYFTNDKGLMWVAKSEGGQYYSSIPCCKDEDLKECFLETQKYFNEVLQKKIVMYVVDKAAVDLLQLPEDEYVVVPDRTYADYVYDAEKLRTFSGKKYHKKKNHLSAFKREYECRYEFKFLRKKDEPEKSEGVVSRPVKKIVSVLRRTGNRRSGSVRRGRDRRLSGEHGWSCGNENTDLYADCG